MTIKEECCPLQTSSYKYGIVSYSGSYRIVQLVVGLLMINVEEMIFSGSSQGDKLQKVSQKLSVALGHQVVTQPAIFHTQNL